MITNVIGTPIGSGYAISGGSRMAHEGACPPPSKDGLINALDRERARYHERQRGLLDKLLGKPESGRRSDPHVRPSDQTGKQPARSR